MKFIFKSTYISEQELNILDKGAQETPSLAPSFRGLYSGYPSALPTSHHHASQDLAGARRHAKSSPVTSLSFLDHFFQPSVFCPHSSEPTPGPLWPFSSGPFSQSGSHDVCAPRPAGWLREAFVLAVYDVVEEKLENEPDFQYIPEKAPLDSVHQDDHSLRESMIQLAEGLITGTVLTQFDQLYRKKPGMTMSCAKLPQNISKNRYRDISPYDATRVILKGNEDYINANYINMEIPSSSIINQYIACQGPLPHTCTDFWQMTWEQGSSMVVMLTTQVERGRVKCHQYWPEPTGSSSYGCYQVTCHSEEGNTAYIFRKMTLFNQEKNESRQLTQIQYIAWPDHGVPDDSSDFLNFVCHVRNKRAGKEEPIVVHCSAGIGRTGVLITMETAMCLIECNQPVYPLDIVRTMRDQRAMMIQTPSQYRFVCEAILKVYEEGIVKPLTTSSNK
uniref:Protein tyrosine phosphatase non-receptor type 4 n=1 Tax=Rousettus aegyptiacus TaxID=9407 RepID=A0A7J8JLF3_ROUAE|nr:protein tyrosine phosphatase non-receptor type 4 [Rousettus aegyptiacus]